MAKNVYFESDFPVHGTDGRDGAFAYVGCLSNTKSVVVIDTATNTIVASVPCALQPPPGGFTVCDSQRVAITPDGAFAYVTDLLSGVVSVIATATKQVVSTTSACAAPP